MATETLVLLLTFALSFVYLLLPSAFTASRTSPTKLAGSRDDIPPSDNVYEQRAVRANNNFRETAPWAIGLLILVQVTGGANGTSALGAWIYFICRCVYIPAYLSGIPYIRSLVWTASVVGLIMIALQA